MTPDGFDVSKWQTPSKWDWPALAAISQRHREYAGRPLILIARATYGAKMVDPRFGEYVELAREHGLLVGAYHFYRQIHSARNQLTAWDRAMDLIADLGPGELLPVLDMESNEPNGDGRPAKDSWNRDCKLIAETWRERYGGCILYYSSYFPDLLYAHRGDGGWKWMLDDGYAHWLADYSSEPGKPRTPYTDCWHLHQPAPRPVPQYAGGIHPVDCDYAAPELDLGELVIPAYESDGRENIYAPYDEGE